MLEFTTLDEAIRSHVHRWHAGDRSPWLFEARIPYIDMVMENLSLMVRDWNKALTIDKPIIKPAYSVFMIHKLSLMPYGLLRMYSNHKAEPERPMRVYIDEVVDVWPELMIECGVSPVLIAEQRHPRPKGNTHFFKLELPR